MTFTPVTEKLILGSDYTKPGKISTFQLGTRVVAALTPGNKKGMRTKLGGNEDSCGYLVSDSGEQLLLLADSHVGTFAGEFAVTHFLSHMEQAEGGCSERLFQTHFLLDRAIQGHKENDAEILKQCATTLVSAWIENGNLHYCSSGDSLFFLIREGEVHALQERHQQLFVGGFSQNPVAIRAFINDLVGAYAEGSEHQFLRIGYGLTKILRFVKSTSVTEAELAQMLQALRSRSGLQVELDLSSLIKPWSELSLRIAAKLPEVASIKLQPGDILFMATDGIEEDVSACPFEKIEKVLLSGKEPMRMAEDIVSLCLTRKGGMDNVTVLVVAV